jgi:hypothetical protein
MSTRIARGRYPLAAVAASLACALGAAVPSTASASGSGPSNVCKAVGLPSTTQTIGVKGVFHVTAFTCGDATATGFQQCPKQTIAVPDVVHATLYYCLPLQIGVGLGPTGDTVVVGGVGGVSAGTG